MKAFKLEPEEIKPVKKINKHYVKKQKNAVCKSCFGQGIIRNHQTQRYEKCACGKPPNLNATAKLVKQERLEKRLQELKEKGW